MSWNVKYALLIAVSILVTWLSGVFIDRSQKAGRGETMGKLTVAVSFLINLSILGFFKYFDFALDNVNFILNKIGIGMLEKPFDFVLPVGISFYTFQALSYTVDVYRKEIKPEPNLLKYALFVSFFPQLVAGPIERSGNLLAQIRRIDKTERKELLNYNRITSGLMIMLWGFFLKMVIADRIAILVDTVFDSWYFYGSVGLIIAAAAFSIQIYCDFAGYSTIAIGASKVLGFTLMENFNTPYFASGIQDFWRRWHISLSTWFRDYLYIPLGGSRCSHLRRNVNLMVTFLVSGLWHGADWHFVAWGGLHGLYQVIGMQTRQVRDKVYAALGTKTESFSYRFGQSAVTFVLATAAWIFFRAGSLGQACGYIQRIFTKPDWWALFDGTIYRLGLSRPQIHILILALVFLLLVSLIKYLKNETLDVFLSKQCLWFRWLVVAGMSAAIFLFGIYGPGFEADQFIYFQF